MVPNLQKPNKVTWLIDNHFLKLAYFLETHECILMSHDAVLNQDQLH